MMTVAERSQSYIDRVSDALRNTEASSRGECVTMGAALDGVFSEIRAARDEAEQLLFIGNGAGAGMASHMATDFTKNGGVSALSFNDPALLTCFANDYGYDLAFAKAVEAHGSRARILFALSSSGASANIVNAARVARRMGIKVVTLSGFAPDNPLRALGDWSFWVPASEYGLVEVAQQALLHAILDLAMGWGE